MKQTLSASRRVAGATMSSPNTSWPSWAKKCESLPLPQPMSTIRHGPSNSTHTAAANGDGMVVCRREL